MRVTLLGTGTSTGVPLPGCRCAVCLSPNERNKRLRCSVLIESSPGSPSSTNVLIDTSTDLRAQALRFEITRVDAVLYTHAHADHIFGFDDLRCFNFVNQKSIPLYAAADCAQELRRVFAYAFKPDPNYRGAVLPQLTLNEIKPLEPFELEDLKILPLPIEHGDLPVLGFRIGDFAYLTDCSKIPEETEPFLESLSVLVVDGLRNRPSYTHFTQEEALKVAEQLKPTVTFLTHLSHEIEYDTANKRLRELTTHNVQLAYDGLSFDL